MQGKKFNQKEDTDITRQVYTCEFYHTDLEQVRDRLYAFKIIGGSGSQVLFVPPDPAIAIGIKSIKS